jgi:Na+/melibiose symporter-like transporter
MNMKEQVDGASVERQSTGTQTAGLERGSFRVVLRNRPFLLLWIAQLLSQIVFNAANYGVIVVVTQVTGSTIMVGLAIISFTLPAVPFSLIAGVYVDYLDKRFVLWTCNALRAIATALIVVALIWNPRTVIPLYLLSFVISLITQFFTPAEASSIPMLVGRKELVPALSLFNITLTLSQAIGFLLLGRLISAIFSPFHIALGFARVLVQPIDMLFVVVAVSYILCSLLILAIPSGAWKHEQAVKHEQDLSIGRRMLKVVRHDVRESWQIIRGDHSLFVALLDVSYISVLLLVIGELAGPYVQNVLHLPVGNITLIFAPAGVGLVLGGVVMPRLTRWLGNQRAIALGSVFTAAVLILLPPGRFVIVHNAVLMPWLLFFIGAMAFILGLALDTVNIPAQTVMQEHTPEDVRGRVFAFQSMLYNAGSIPVILFVGIIADSLGIETVFYILAAAVLAFQLWTRFYVRVPYSKTPTNTAK